MSLRDFNLIKDYDVVIVGSGIAGLSVAYYLDRPIRAAVLSKAPCSSSSSWVAQGGVAASISKFDSPERHFEDTIEAGDGLCDEQAVSILVNEGRERIVEMIRLGVPFDRVDDEFDFALEGGHRIARVLHHADRTGEAIVSTLRKYLESVENIDFFENFFLEEILVSEGAAAGVSGTLDGEPTVFLAPFVVIATGGAGQVFFYTTNPEVATADGIAAAFRAGARLRDLEFIQFHPTVLNDGVKPMLLISEAVRGRGARLLDEKGERIMAGYHEMEELAPRHVVVRRMAEFMEQPGFTTFYLDMRHFSDEDWSHFPFIRSELKRRGFNPDAELIPVVPAAHYTIGGIQVDLNGESTLLNLFACGEASSTGVHGANRLASNSLLEGLVFGCRIARKISGREFHRPVEVKPGSCVTSARYNVDRAVLKLQKETWDAAGPVREGDKLKRFFTSLEDRFVDALTPVCGNRKLAEFSSLVIFAYLMASAAFQRRESRGVHLRKDFAGKDEALRTHLGFTRKDFPGQR